MTALSTPETVTTKLGQEFRVASPRELVARDIARLVKQSIAAEAKWGSGSLQAKKARDESDKILGKVDRGVASEGVARAYDFEPQSLDEAPAVETKDHN